MPVKVAPSLLSADFGRLRDAVQLVEEHGADWIHFDVMDGHFVPAITIGPAVMGSLRPHSSITFDAHLMVENPGRHLETFARAGANLITVHAEATNHLDSLLRRIRSLGVKTGVALNPATPPAVVEYVWPLLDLLLVMSVNPGEGGQKFIPEVIPKITYLAAQIREHAPSVELQVDGGINAETAPRVIEAGATVLVAGSAVFKAEGGMDLIRAFKLNGGPPQAV